MTQEEFNKQYLGVFEPDPVLQECVAFMRYATQEEVRQCRRDNLFTVAQIREAQRIIETERT